MQQIAGGILEARDATLQSKRTKRFAPAGQSTQFIVGATPSPDADMLTKSAALYQQFHLRRAYYSAFSPIPHADPTLPLVKIPLIREHRLYQADWLLRFYGFSPAELTTEADPNLALDKDPKLAWALRHREFFPIDVNKAGKNALLRVPGFGVRNVKRILKIRRYRALTLTDLAKLKISVKKSRFFIVAAGHNPAAMQIDTQQLPQRFDLPEQLGLFEAASTARSGEI